MKKKWQKTAEGRYSFLFNDKEIGHMEIDLKSSDTKAIFKTGDNDFILRRTGLWKTSLEISDGKGIVISKASVEKWYANSYSLEHHGKKYKLMIRNNPLAEWVILENSKELLSYGIDVDNGQILVKITSGKGNQDSLLDFLLWYLFLPIVNENSGEDFLFFMNPDN